MYIWKVVLFISTWTVSIVPSISEESSAPNNAASARDSVLDTTLDNILFKTVYSCEANVLHLDCVQGNVIHIIRANYGRLIRNVLNETGQVRWSGELCMPSYSILSDRCEQKNTCNVRVTSTLFGDTCHGTITYLDVQYACVSPSNATSASEHSSLHNSSSASELGSEFDTPLDGNLFKTVYACKANALHISCVQGSFIHMIHSNYGQLTRHLSNETDQVMLSEEHCAPVKSSIIMAKRCEQKQECNVKVSNTLFGNACHGKIKYLDVQYVCVSPSVGSTTEQSEQSSIRHISFGSELDLKPNITLASTVSSTTELSFIPNATSASELDTVPDTTLDISLSKTIYSCEHNVLHLRCVEGSVIHIIRAIYGRLSRDLCNEDGQVMWSGKQCTAIRSSIIMADRCEQKESCSIPASNTLFGDPCYGTIKYLEVQYVCDSPSNVSSTTEQSSILNSSSVSELDSKPDTTLDSRHFKTQHSCENSVLHLGCVEGSVIHIIRANYGRLTRELCNADRKVVWSGQQCMSIMSFSIITNRCEQKQSCSVPASNTLFGDPCYGTIKYLEVQYVCVSPSNSFLPNGSSASEPGTTLVSKHFKTEYACENNVLHLHCVEAGVIHLIRANYGRLTRNVCNDDGQVKWLGQQCMSDKSYTIMTNRCEQKESCSVPASNTLFGDPCYGTIKYLEAQYVCVSPSNDSSTTEEVSILNSSSSSELESKPDTVLDSEQFMTKYSCENSVLHLGCVKGSVIRIIRANYGRLTRELCNADRKVVWSGERCTTIKSTSITADRCDQKKRCSVRASNALFGDPCYGTIKYLEVQYVCVPPSTDSTTEQSSIRRISFASEHDPKPNVTLDSKIKTQYSCENNVLHLGCVEGGVIHIIQASYGRSTIDLCNKDGKVRWSGKLCTSMRSSILIVANRCEQKQSCNVQASNTLFGDPCYGTIKYLEVQYSCI